MSSRDLEADSTPFCIERSKHDIYPFISPHAGLKGCAEGKTVLVTGRSSGIGMAIAKYFALAGADAVIICGRTVTALEEARFAIQTAVPSCKVSWTHADVTSPESVENLFRGIPFKYLDILVNNAGAAASQEEIRDSDVIDWWSDFELNVKGVYLCSRAYLRRRNGKPGVILNVSSSVSNVVNPGLSSYAISKTAVNRLTEFIHAGKIP
jgi:NAD(P)-dependent dehydrogenase (short-subunit alcohol dehydrogenase family)